MYAHVTVFKSTPEPLWYRIPAELREAVSIGALVQVSVRTQRKHGVVMAIQQSIPILKRPATFKPIIALVTIPHDPWHAPLLQKLAFLHQMPISMLQMRLQTFLGTAPTREHINRNSEMRPDQSVLPALTDEQERAYCCMAQQIGKPTEQPFVLHGVTGSGKTELYKRLIIDAHARGLSTIFMAPEVTLALAFEHTFAQQLSNLIPIFGFHSATTPKQKRALWKAACTGTAGLIIGVHLPVLLPLSNLGLIIVDEEHDPGYGEKKHPKIQSRIAALMRAHLMKIPIILGSATPSTHTLYGVEKRGWKLITLTKRFSGAFAQIKIVNLTQKTERHSFWISRELKAAIAQRLHQQEQSIIFLNRRGYSFFVQCKQCGYCFCCDACSVTLTLHQSGHLICHYCGFKRLVPDQCSACPAQKKALLKRGIGTQQTVEIIQRLFPRARIGRADLDITKKKTAWKQTLMAFTNRELDILVGTQTITKGYDFPGVTLVGAIWADMQLHVPAYNATEVALAQLIQVAGRAGRHTKNAEVIMQVMQDNPCFAYLNEQKYTGWYAQEIAARTALSYPPCARVICIELRHSSEALLAKESELLYYALKEQTPTEKIALLGPSLPPVAKIKHIHTRQILMKADNYAVLYHTYRAAYAAHTWHAQLFVHPLW